MAKQNLLRSTALLTFSGIIAKSVDFIFRTYYSAKLGAEGLGILSLCFSVHGIMLNIATGGLGTAVSSIVSGKLARKEFADIKKTMNIAFKIVLFLSFAVIVFIQIFAKDIATYILKEPRCALGLIMLSPSILFMGISYCIKGYFYASRQVFPPASSEFLEQAVKITSITLILAKYLPMGAEYGCAAIFTGISIGEFSSCLYLSIFYALSQKKTSSVSASSKKLRLLLLKISLPIMASSLAGSYLRMQEEVLVISSLKRFGLSHTYALSLFGSIHGMVMPIIVFPLTLFSSCFTLLVPEISRAFALKNPIRLKTLVSKIYRFCSFLGFLVWTCYYLFADSLTQTIYGNTEIGRYLKALSFIAPLMFMDSSSCGILNGMSKQGRLFCFSLSDSLLRIALIVILVPKFGINAFILAVITSNLFTYLLTSFSVLKASQLHFCHHQWLWAHIFCAALTVFVAGSPLFKGLKLIPAILITILIYIITEVCTNKNTKSDAKWFCSRMIMNK